MIRMMALFLVSLLALSCRKESPDCWRGDGSLCRLTVNAGTEGSSTKAVGVADSLETSVSRVQAFLYDVKENLAAAGCTTGSSITVSAVPGDYTLFVLVNAPEVPMEQSATVTALKTVRSALEDNAVGNLVAFGFRDVTLFSGETSFNVQAKRLASKVMLDRITKDFSKMESLSGTRLKVNSIYLTNVAADCCLEGGFPTAYANAMGYKGEAAGITHDDVGTVVDSCIDVRHTFYAYENPVEMDSVGGTWCPRRSRLVIDATVDTVHCYYVVNLPVIGRNRIYEITNLIIMRPGSNDQETISGDRTVALEVEVLDYNTDAYNESFEDAPIPAKKRITVTGGLGEWIQ